jgi:hypothetical protein
MVSSPMRWFAVAAILAIAAAEPSEPSAPAEKPASQPAPATGPPTSLLDGLKVPDDAVLVIVDKASDYAKMVPKGIFLSLEKYQELTAELERLRGRGRGERAVAPSSCDLKGKAEGGILNLRAQFEFFTEKPLTTVRLGCVQAHAYEVDLDGGRKPLLRNDPTDGFTVVLDKPGNHLLTLNLALALTARGTGSGIELDLPRAAINKLELELPAGSRDLSLGGNPLNDPLLEFKGNVLKGSLPASSDRLDLTWAGPAAGPGALTVAGRIQVRLDERQTAVEAELLLRRQGGEADAWKVLVQPGSDVKLPSGEEDKLAAMETDDKTYAPFASLRTLRLKAPATSVKLIVTNHGPPTRPGSATPVGPFAVPGATRQEGELLVSGAAPGLRLDFQRRGDLSRRSPSPEESQNDPTLVAAFHYWGVPLPEKPGAATGPGSLSLLDIEAEAVQGLVEARVSHVLQLARDGSGARRWRLKTRVEATPVRSGLEQMRVQLPPGFRYAPDSSSADPAVRSVDLNEKTNVLTFHLTGAESKAFTPGIDGEYTAAMPDSGKATLLLPRPLDARDLGGQVSLTVPDDLEFVPGDAGNPALEATNRDGQSQTWRSTKFPERVEAAWRSFRPELIASSEVDLTLTPTEGLVRHTLRFHFPRTPPDQIALHVPLAVSGRLRVVRGGRLSSRELFGPSVRVIDLRSAGEPSPGRDVTVVVEYSFLRTEGGTADAARVVPLVHPETAARGEIKVRVWSDPGAAPLPPGGAWAEQNVEEVQGQDRLPALVLRAQRLDAPLTLPMTAADGPTISVLTERVLVRALVTEGGGQSYRVGFLLERLDSRFLDVELPAPTAGLGLKVSLNGKQVSWDPVDDDGQHAIGGHVARLRLGPQLVKRGSVLEVAYDLPPGRAATGLLQTTLLPPVLRGDPVRVPTRWLVQLPQGWIPIGPEGGPGQERTWTRRGWFFVPRPSVTDADLERWLAVSEAVAGPRGDDLDVPSLTCWRERPEPLRLTHAPQQGWLLACSLGVLGLGLSLYALARSGVEGRLARWFVPAAAVLAAGLAVAALLWPGAAAAVAFGCEPGAAVLTLAIPLLWLQHERHRRRSAFPASFSRSRTASPSSLLRAGSQRAPGEPSTVDVPRPNGNPPRSSPDLPRLEGSGSNKGSREPQGSSGPGS